MKILVTGDSIINHIGEHLGEGLSKKHSVTHKCFPGISIEGLNDEISSLNNQFDWVLVHVGTNNADRGDSVTSILKKFDCLFEVILSLNPDAKVVVSGILPRNVSRFPEDPAKKALFEKYLPYLNAKIDEINCNLQWHCSSHERMFFYRSPRPLVGRDGLHLGGLGHALLAGEFVDILNNLISKEHVAYTNLSFDSFPSLVLEVPKLVSAVPQKGVLKQSPTGVSNVQVPTVPCGEVVKQDPSVVTYAECLSLDSFSLLVPDVPARQGGVVKPVLGGGGKGGMCKKVAAGRRGGVWKQVPGGAPRVQVVVKKVPSGVQGGVVRQVPCVRQGGVWMKVTTGHRRGVVKQGPTVLTYETCFLSHNRFSPLVRDVSKHVPVPRSGVKPVTAAPKSVRKVPVPRSGVKPVTATPKSVRKVSVPRLGVEPVTAVPQVSVGEITGDKYIG